jgi:hypothetical protein
MKGGEGGEKEKKASVNPEGRKKSKVEKKVIFSQTCPERSIKKP